MEVFIKGGTGLHRESNLHSLRRYGLDPDDEDKIMDDLVIVECSTGTETGNSTLSVFFSTAPQPTECCCSGPVLIYRITTSQTTRMRRNRWRK